ncbi:MAG: SRPBCC family protein [Armatimonadetes bacterium]|nr:SRPBCC family protein [Armatimonadota bacterium]
MPYVEASIFIQGTPEETYLLAKDMEKFPDYMQDVEKVSVIQKEGNRTVTEWVTQVEGTPIIWTEEDLFDDNALKITYRLIEGDLDKFEGEWVFEAKDGGTQVRLGVEYDFGIPSLTELIGPTIEIKVRENSEMMLRGMKERIEGGHKN